jgi:hypothetical protein
MFINNKTVAGNIFKGIFNESISNLAGKMTSVETIITNKGIVKYRYWHQK